MRTITKTAFTVALILALVLAPAAKALACGTDEAQNETIISEDAETPSNATLDKSYYEEQVEKYNAMNDNVAEIMIRQNGAYQCKSIKLYGREVTGVNPDGSFKMGQWELLDSEVSKHSGDWTRLYAMSTYVEYAFSFDIYWGTDFPYSGVFWVNHDEMIDNIEIITGGLVRTSSLVIKVNGRTVFDDWNLPSHKEWTPPKTAM